MGSSIRDFLLGSEVEVRAARARKRAEWNWVCVS